MRIYIGINQKAKEEITKSGATKLPYLRISLPPETEGGEWTDVGVAWMTDKRTGFNVKLNDGWNLVFKETSEMKVERENKELKERARVAAMEKREANDKPLVYPEEDIDPNDIPF